MVQRSVTLPNGRVYNQSVDYTRTGNGGYNRNVLWIGPQVQTLRATAQPVYDALIQVTIAMCCG
jgi:hypothetical protein